MAKKDSTIKKEEAKQGSGPQVVQSMPVVQPPPTVQPPGGSLLPIIKLEEFLSNKSNENKILIAGFKVWCKINGKQSATLKEYEQLLSNYKTMEIK